MIWNPPVFLSLPFESLRNHGVLHRHEPRDRHDDPPHTRRHREVEGQGEDRRAEQGAHGVGGQVRAHAADVQVGVGTKGLAARGFVAGDEADGEAWKEKQEKMIKDLQTREHAMRKCLVNADYCLDAVSQHLWNITRLCIPICFDF